MASGAGFYMFSSRPQGSPEIVDPSIDLLKDKFLNTLKNPGFLDFMEAEGKSAACQWV